MPFGVAGVALQVMLYSAEIAGAGVYEVGSRAYQSRISGSDKESQVN
jgi:hypothetical protein